MAKMDIYGPLGEESLEWILGKIKEFKVKSVLEIGTGHGLTAIAFSKVCKNVSSIEKSNDRFDEALEHIIKEKANVKLIKGDALEALKLIDEKFDLVFIDAASTEYLDYFRDALRVAKKLIIADNVISHKDKMKEFLEYVKKFEYEEVDIDKGMIIIYL